MSGVVMTAERTAGSRTVSGEAPVPVRLAAVYVPAPLPREGRIAFWDPAGEPLPAASGDPEELTVVRRHGAGVRRRQVPALGLPLAEALPLLV
ncbi:ATP-dependent helicase, partial [Streptomyces sp. Adlamb9]